MRGAFVNALNNWAQDAAERAAIEQEGCDRPVELHYAPVPEPTNNEKIATPEQLAELRARNMAAPLRDPWWVLGTATERRSAAAQLVKLGLHPIAIHGMSLDGSCTCYLGAKCGTAGKHPIMKGWERAELDAPVLDQQLAVNWAWNLGLRMGKQPNGWFLVAIDVDGPRDLLSAAEQEAGQAFPPTLEARTGSGGTHLIYKIDPSLAPRNKVRRYPGIDIRSEGGQIVCAPSRHKSGSSYVWTNLQEPAVLK